jgi:hypothetical protein
MSDPYRVKVKVGEVRSRILLRSFDKGLLVRSPTQQINPVPKATDEICSASATRQSVARNPTTIATSNHHAGKLRSCNLFDAIVHPPISLSTSSPT